MQEFGFQWHITNVCNLRCMHCYQDDSSSKNDLGWKELKSICDNIFSFLKESKKKATINITGGEPFLKKELYELLGYFDQSKYIRELAIITNATIIDKATVNRLNAFSKLKTIKISFEGLDETNDLIRQEGVFKKIESAIGLFKDFGRCDIVAMFTLMKRNIHELPFIFNFCEDNKLNGLIVERFVPLGRGGLIKKDSLDCNEWKEAARLIADYCGASFGNDGEDFLPYRAFWIIFGGDRVTLKGAFCNVGDGALCIMPDGEVYPCRRFNLSIGNLLRASLGDILKGAYILKEVRQKKNLKGKCKTCGIANCIGCRAMAYSLTNDYLGEDTQCWYSKPR